MSALNTAPTAASVSFGFSTSRSSSLAPTFPTWGKVEGHDLACIGRISEDFLISGNRSIEANFRLRIAGCTTTRAFDDCSISQNYHGSRFSLVQGAGECVMSALAILQPATGGCFIFGICVAEFAK